jgi:hypothetical protein
MKADDQKKSRDVRRGALMIATAATFLLITGCDSRPPGPYQPSELKERQDQKDREEADGSLHSGHIGRSGGHIPGTAAGSGIHADPQTGTVRGGFGKTGAIHASAS